MIHHVHVPRAVLACTLLALVAAANPVCAADDGKSITSLSVSDPGPGLQAAAAPAPITPAAPTATTNGLLTFTNQTEFQTAFPGLPKEDFEESPVAAGNFLWCTAPINSSTNNSCFLPGDILPGLEIDSLLPPSNPATALHVAGNGYLGTVVSDIVGEGSSTTGLEISFPGADVFAAGMDLSVYSNATGTIKIYGPSNTLLDTINKALTPTPAFFGIYSNQPITRITIESPDWELVDNIQFGGTPSNLTFYTSQATFTAAHPGLPVEDFEESPIADNAGLGFTGPLNSSTNNAYFAPGDILNGLQLNSDPSTSMFIVGGNYSDFGNTSKAVGSNSAPDNLRIDFTNYDAYAVGMDLMRALAAGNASIAVYGPHGALLGIKILSLPRTATFFGVYSNQPITRIDLIAPNDGEMVDNIRFGGSPADLTFYNSQALFLAARPGLPVEDFEESPVADGGVITCTQPFSSATNEAGCFAPGDIIPGITFQPQSPCTTDCTMAVLGAGYNLAPSKEIAPTWCVNDLEITFAKKNVRYFGSNIRSFFGPADYLLSFYDDHGNLIGSALRNIGTTPIYLGAISQKHISKILVTDVMGCEIVDNVRFGAFPWQTIIPAISSH